MPWFRHPIHYRLLDPANTTPGAARPLFSEESAVQVLLAPTALFAAPIRMSLRAYVPLEVEFAPQQWLSSRRVMIDSGAGLSTFSAEWAREFGIALPPRSCRLQLDTATGRVSVTVYDLDLNVRFPRLRDCPFSLAVVFSEAHPPTTPPLIGLHNLLNYWRFTFDGSFDPAAAMGHMRFDTL